MEPITSDWLNDRTYYEYLFFPFLLDYNTKLSADSKTTAIVVGVLQSFARSLGISYHSFRNFRFIFLRLNNAEKTLRNLWYENSRNHANTERFCQWQSPFFRHHIDLMMLCFPPFEVKILKKFLELVLASINNAKSPSRCLYSTSRRQFYQNMIYSKLSINRDGRETPSPG